MYLYIYMNICLDKDIWLRLHTHLAILYKNSDSCVFVHCKIVLLYVAPVKYQNDLAQF